LKEEEVYKSLGNSKKDSSEKFENEVSSVDEVIEQSEETKQSSNLIPTQELLAQHVPAGPSKIRRVNT